MLQIALVDRRHRDAVMVSLSVSVFVVASWCRKESRKDQPRMEVVGEPVRCCSRCCAGLIDVVGNDGIAGKVACGG